MKKATVFILLLLMLVGCNQMDGKRNKDLEKSIYSIVEDKSQSEISINSLTSFDWEEAFLFSPYTTQESIDKQIGTGFKDVSNIDARDDIYLLIFLNGDKVVEYVEIVRQGSDFSIGEEKYLTASNDVIIIERH